METTEDSDVPEEPGAWDSGSEGGDWDPEPDDEEEEGPDQGDEERMKTRGGHVRQELMVTLPSSFSP